MLTLRSTALAVFTVKCSKQCGVPSEQESLSDYVRRVANEKNLSHREVARRSGGLISHVTVGDIINNNRGDVKVETLRGLARGLGVPEEEVFAVARGKSLTTAEAFDGEFAVLFKGFHDLSPEDQAEMMATVRMLAAEVQRRRPRKPPGGKGKNGRK